jgi:tryptophan-rich sensory protein
LPLWVFILLFAITSTFLYFQQAGIAAQAFADRAARTQFFGQVDLIVNTLTLVIQVFLTSRILKWLGVAMTMWHFGRVRRSAAWLLAPYLAWVSFATALTWAVWQRNPGQL